MANIHLTYIIIGITCIVSFIAFSNQKMIDDLIFYPPAVNNRKQWYRFITCGFIHADVAHLAFNMYSLYMFGEAIENMFADIFGRAGNTMYLLLYLSALVVCLLPTFRKHKNNYHYKSLGASGAVSAVVFAFIFLQPLVKLNLLFLPSGLAFYGFMFGAIYLGVTAFLDKRGGGNINHSAHLWGALYGIVFLIIACAAFGTYNPLQSFVEQVKEVIH